MPRIVVLERSPAGSGDLGLLSTIAFGLVVENAAADADAGGSGAEVASPGVTPRLGRRRTRGRTAAPSTPLLYQAGANDQPRGQSVCRDITQGGNVSHPVPTDGYQAGPGYDAVTGSGVPDGAALLAAIR